MTVPQKTINRFNIISNKIPIALFFKKEKPIIKYIWNLKGPQIVKTILEKKYKLGEFTFCYYKSTVSKSVVLPWGYTYRPIKYNGEPRNKLVSVVSWLSTRVPVNGERSLQQMVLGKMDAHMQKGWNWALFFYHIQKLTQHGLKI